MGFFVEGLEADQSEFWSAAPSDEDYTRLDRLLQRVPPHLSEILKLCPLGGMSQGDAGRLLRVSQPTIYYRLEQARERVRLVDSLVLDYTPDELRVRLRRASLPPREVWLISGYWRHHTVTSAVLEASLALGMDRAIPFSSAHDLIHHGRWRLSSTPPLRRIAQDIDTIKGWQVGGGRAW